MHRFFRNKNFTVGFILSLVVVIAAAVSLLWTPYDANRMNARDRLQGPSWQHPLGTDQYGRDLLSRLLHGAPSTVFFGLGATALGVAAGSVIGVVARPIRGQKFAHFCQTGRKKRGSM